MRRHFWRAVASEVCRGDHLSAGWSPGHRQQRHPRRIGGTRESRQASQPFYFLRALELPPPRGSQPPTHAARRGVTSIQESRGIPARDLENDVSGSPKPPDEIRMIDGVSLSFAGIAPLHYTVSCTRYVDPYVRGVSVRSVTWR